MSLWCPIMKKRRLLCESEFFPNNKLNLTLKNDGKRSFSYETKASMSIIPMSRMSYWYQSWKERRLLCESEFVLIEKRSLIPKNRGKKSFSYETKDQCHLPQWGEWVYGAQ